MAHHNSRAIGPWIESRRGVTRHDTSRKRRFRGAPYPEPSRMQRQIPHLECLALSPLQASMHTHFTGVDSSLVMIMVTKPTMVHGIAVTLRYHQYCSMNHRSYTASPSHKSGVIITITAKTIAIVVVMVVIELIVLRLMQYLR